MPEESQLDKTRRAINSLLDTISTAVESGHEIFVEIKGLKMTYNEISVDYINIDTFEPPGETQ